MSGLAVLQLVEVKESIGNKVSPHNCCHSSVFSIFPVIIFSFRMVAQIKHRPANRNNMLRPKRVLVDNIHMYWTLTLTLQLSHDQPGSDKCTKSVQCGRRPTNQGFGTFLKVVSKPTNQSTYISIPR